MAKHPDSWYISSFKSGGRKREKATTAFTQQFIGYARKLQKKFNLNETQVLDIYTDGLVALILRVETGSFRGESSLGTYFYRICYNKCVDLLRKRTSNTIEYVEQHSESVQDQIPEIEAWYDKFRFDDIRSAIDAIGEPCAQILIDWGFWGYKMEEIAERVGYNSADQVKKRKYKCLQQLRERIAKLDL